MINYSKPLGKKLLTAFFAEKRKEHLLHLAAAGLGAALGFFIMAKPPESIVGLITLVAIFLIVIGLAHLIRCRGKNRLRSRERQPSALCQIDQGRSFLMSLFHRLSITLSS